MRLGMHGMFYADDAAALREFFRDKLGFPATDVGDGWLIMDVPSADLGVHPRDYDGAPPSGTAEISFYCGDIRAAMAELRGRGVEFAGEPEDHGFGWVAHLLAPGGLRIQLYQPHYEKGGPG